AVRRESGGIPLCARARRLCLGAATAVGGAMGVDRNGVRLDDAVQAERGGLPARPGAWRAARVPAAPARAVALGGRVRARLDGDARAVGDSQLPRPSWLVSGGRGWRDRALARQQS